MKMRKFFKKNQKRIFKKIGFNNICEKQFQNNDKSICNFFEI